MFGLNPECFYKVLSLFHKDFMPAIFFFVANPVISVANWVISNKKIRKILKECVRILFEINPYGNSVLKKNKF